MRLSLRPKESLNSNMQRRCPAKALVGLGDGSSKRRVVVRVAQAGYLLANRLLAVLQPPGQLAIDEGMGTRSWAGVSLTRFFRGIGTPAGYGPEVGAANRTYQLSMMPVRPAVPPVDQYTVFIFDRKLLLRAIRFQYMAVTILPTGCTIEFNNDVLPHSAVPNLFVAFVFSRIHEFSMNGRPSLTAPVEKSFRRDVVRLLLHALRIGPLLVLDQRVCLADRFGLRQQSVGVEAVGFLPGVVAVLVGTLRVDDVIWLATGAGVAPDSDFEVRVVTIPPGSGLGPHGAAAIMRRPYGFGISSQPEVAIFTEPLHGPRDRPCRVGTLRL